jgi:hypothetical protein
MGSIIEIELPPLVPSEMVAPIGAMRLGPLELDNPARVVSGAGIFNDPQPVEVEAAHLGLHQRSRH